MSQPLLALLLIDIQPCATASCVIDNMAIGRAPCRRRKQSAANQRRRDQVFKQAVLHFMLRRRRRTAVTSQTLIFAYYGQESSRDYFVGCSRGGGQVLMKAQRYPEDFNGIVAGAQAYRV